jgi:hypothetical protein
MMADHIRFSDRISRLDVSHQGRKAESYRCLDCLDTRFATIFTPETVARISSDPEALRRPDWDHPKYWRTCVVLCPCKASERHGGKWSENSNSPQAGKHLPVFGEQPWHIAANRPDAKARVADYKHKPANYNEEFAGLNS